MGINTFQIVLKKNRKSIEDSAVFSFPFSFFFWFYSSQFSFLFSFCLAVFGLGALPFRQHFYRAMRIACTPLFFPFPLPLAQAPCPPSVLAVAPGCCFIIFLRLPPVFLELSSWRLPLPVLPARDIPIHSHPHSLTFTLTLIPGFRFAFTALALPVAMCMTTNDKWICDKWSMWPKVENTFYTQTEREIPTARGRGRERERGKRQQAMGGNYLRLVSSCCCCHTLRHLYRIMNGKRVFPTMTNTH